MAIQDQFLSEEERRHRQFAAILSLVVSTLLMLVKFWAHNITRSQAIFSDALESIVNVMAAGVALWVIHYSAKPADEDHPYGHGKVEFFSAAFEGGLISFASLLIVVEAVRSYLRGESLHSLNVGILLISLAGVANLALGVFLVQRGKKLSSIALKASGSHVISDFWTSAAVIVGLGLAQFSGLMWLDSALALGVGLWLGFTGMKLVIESVAGLMDREDPSTLNHLAEVFRRCIKDGIIQLHHVKVIRSGWYHHIDAHIVMPEFWDVLRVHDQINAFEKAVIANYEFGGEMNFHVDPCRRAYCRVCDLKDCPVRAEAFKERIDVELDHLRSPLEPPEFRMQRKN